ncbi:MAG: crosslink repair DNA glycosylase YcaQ family protein [Rhizobiaceae bacterium]
MELSLTNKQARHVVLHLQGLTREPHVKFSDGGLLALIHQLGFVQVDSIQWVERAQHMTLFARNQTYRPNQLADLIEAEGSLFEGWTHDASVIPSSFYPYWRHRFERSKEKLSQQFKKWQRESCLDGCEDILKRVRAEGSLRSRDMEKDKSKSNEMWQWHDGKAALEFLWRTGELCISKREGFQKVYDLSERGIAAEDYERRVSHKEFVDWACRSAIERLGFGSARDIAKYWDTLSIQEVQDWVKSAGGDQVISVRIAGVKGAGEKQLLARSDIAQVVEQLDKLPKRVRALSPFDPVIRDRKRLSWLFGFEYRIEIYVPEAKRKWGYYVYPLLEGDRLIGRIDMRAKRKEGVLEVKRVWLEEGVRFSNARRQRLEAELTRQARLGGVGDVIWLKGALVE